MALLEYERSKTLKRTDKGSLLAREKNNVYSILLETAVVEIVHEAPDVG